MTIDEAIKHCEEVARSCDWNAAQCDETDGYECHEKAGNEECASDHRQLAAWLRELKELRLTVGMIKVENLKSALTLIREYKADNNEMREQIERLDSENYKLTERLEEVRAALNDHVDLVLWHEEREKEYKRLLKAAVEDMHIEDMCDVCVERIPNSPIHCPDGSDCFVWRYKDEALKLIGDKGE